MVMIDGVHIIPLRKISDDRGCVMHMLRADDPHFKLFGEIYFSVVHPQKIKAWAQHKDMTLHYAVVSGSIRLVIYDVRLGSSTYGKIDEIQLGQESYVLVVIPPKLWYGFQGISSCDAIVANCATLPHDPSEIEKLPIENDIIPYTFID